MLDLFDGAKGEVEEGAGQPTIDKLEELRVPVCAGGIRMKVSACIGKKITLTQTQHCTGHSGIKQSSLHL